MNKKIILMVFAGFVCVRAFSQDTAHTYSFKKDTLFTQEKLSDSQYQNGQALSTANASKMQKKKVMYRDTRLGSSSKFYNTYKKNDYGAGAITTNPNKL